MSSGYVHSVEIGSFVDGPGLRFVVFLAGCPLRCAYCHNPDTWQLPRDKTDSADVLAQIEHTAGFLKAGCGGVTLSGGEPLGQPRFALDILGGSKALGLHTALDTSGYLGDQASDEFLDAVDLVLLDIKSYDECAYRELTGGELEPTLRFARRLSDDGRPMWVRFVLVPGLTDDPEDIRSLARFVATLANVERVEVLPFHQMGEYKWEQLGLEYRLAATEEPTPEMVEQVKSMFEAEGLSVGGDGHVKPCEPAATKG